MSYVLEKLTDYVYLNLHILNPGDATTLHTNIRWAPFYKGEPSLRSSNRSPFSKAMS